GCGGCAKATKRSALARRGAGFHWHGRRCSAAALRRRSRSSPAPCSPPRHAIRGRRARVRVVQGHLAFERAGTATALRRAYAESPLRLLTPRNHGNAAWVYTSTLGGGLLDGDGVRLL